MRVARSKVLDGGGEGGEGGAGGEWLIGLDWAQGRCCVVMGDNFRRACFEVDFAWENRKRGH